MLPISPRTPDMSKPAGHRAGLSLIAVALAGCASSGSPAVAETGHDATVCQAESVMKLLMNSHPGVKVYRTGHGYSVRIRGARGEPLFVVDGVPMPFSEGLLASISPCEIAQLRVLTDPAELSFYGIRGGNGVVLITLISGPRGR